MPTPRKYGNSPEDMIEEAMDRIEANGIASHVFLIEGKPKVTTSPFYIPKWESKYPLVGVFNSGVSYRDFVEAFYETKGMV